MNKRLLIATVIIGSVMAGSIALVIFSYSRTFHTVSIDNPRSITLEITNHEDGEVVSSVSSSRSVNLQNGEYCVSSTDTNYSQTPQCFTVSNKDIGVKIEVGFSTERLSSLLTDADIDAIQDVLHERYGNLLNDYVINKGTLLEYGDWYGTTLTAVADGNEQGDVYRTLLKRNGETWEIIAYPQLSLSKFTYPDVPESILSETNKLSGTY